MKRDEMRKAANNRLTAIMQVRNEADRFLPEVLRELSDFVDNIVIVDDASTDGTADVCRSFPKVTSLVGLEQSKFHKEWELRLYLWQLVCATGPDWILSVDADEIYEAKAKESMRLLINQDQFDWVGFRFYDFWGGRTHYRDDEHWCIHRKHTRTLVRYIPGYHYFFPRMEHHVPRLPLSYAALPGLLTELRVKHLGWAVGKEELYRKYERYVASDPQGRWGSLAQYESILDEHPNLVEWKED